MVARDPLQPTLAVDLRALVQPPAGIGVHTEEMLLALARRGRFRLVGLAHHPLAEPERLLSAGISLQIGSAPSGFLWQHFRAARETRSAGAQVFWSPVFTLPWRLDVPALVTVHDLAAWEAPETLTWKVRWSLRPFLGRSLHRAARVLAVSQSVAGELLERFPAVEPKLRVIPNGVDPSRFRPASAEEIRSTREELGLPAGYFLFLGTLEPRKNVAPLLRAWETLPTPRPPLLLVGAAGWKSETVRRDLVRLEPAGVRWLGRLEPGRAREILRAATALVYPSRYEGFGLPVLEAMASGVPVVTSRARALVELGGEACLQGDPGEPEAFSRLLLEVWRNESLRAQLASRGLERARGFGWDRAAQAFEEELERLLEETSR